MCLYHRLLLLTRHQVSSRLEEFRDLVKEVVRSACRTALLEEGFTPDDYFIDGMESPGLYGGRALVIMMCMKFLLSQF